MDFENYKEKILELLKDFYGHDAEVTMHAVYKGNDTYRTGISVRLFENDNNVAPVVYIDHLYSKYIDNEMSLDAVISELVKMIENANDAEICNCVGDLTDWDFVKDKVFPIVVQTETNAKYMEDLVSKEYLDLSILYNIRLLVDENGVGSVKISNGLFEQYGVSLDELQQQALSNLRNEGYTTKNVFHVLQSHFDELDIPDDICEDDLTDKMYVTTTENGVNGAAVILDTEYFHEKFGEYSLYILPSSIHELIVIPDTNGVDINEINSLIQTVNDSCVPNEEVLSNHAYYYDGTTNMIRCA